MIEFLAANGNRLFWLVLLTANLAYMARADSRGSAWFSALASAVSVDGLIQAMS